MVNIRITFLLFIRFNLHNTSSKKNLNVVKVLEYILVIFKVYDYFDKYTFLCEMYDEDADQIRELCLHFFPFDNSIQVIDSKKGKNLVKRVQLPPLKLEMLQVGNIVNIFSKLLYITDCAPATRKTLFHNVQSTFALIKPVPSSFHGKIITFIMKNGFRIVRMKNGKISKDFAMIMYQNIAGSNMLPTSSMSFDSTKRSCFRAVTKQVLGCDWLTNNHNQITTNHSQELVSLLHENYQRFVLIKLILGVQLKSDNNRIIIDYITTGEVIGLELVAPNAVKQWRSCLGETDPLTAAPGTLRRLYGLNKIKNVAHGCNTVEESAVMLDLFFGYEKNIPRIQFRATMKNCTCCIIKPHVITDGNVGSILETIVISKKFFISAIAMFSVKISNAKEFLEVYKGVLPEYEALCIHMAEGKCIALEVKCNDPKINCVCEFRRLCGPRDPELCRQLYPDSIRALFGKNIIHNAVHCTDLPEDGEQEVEYFFKLLAND